jgi:hypothetical protein
MEEAGSSETSVKFYQTILHHIPEESTLRQILPEKTSRKTQDLMKKHQ